MIHGSNGMRESGQNCLLTSTSAARPALICVTASDHGKPSSLLTDSSSASLMLMKAFRIELSGLETPTVPINLRIASPSCLTVYLSQFANTSVWVVLLRNSESTRDGAYAGWSSDTR